MKRALFLFLFGWGIFVGYTQEIYPTENETHIFWQENRPLTAADFQGDGSALDPESVRFNSENYGLNVVGFLGSWSVLDVPRKRFTRQGLREEKIYFAPAFEKGKSFILHNDTAKIKNEQLMFDLYEVAVRMARKQLKEYRDQTEGSTGIQAIMYLTVKEDVEVFRRQLQDEFINDVYMHPREGAYTEWRTAVDQWLDDLKEYATTPEDCNRFIKDAPLDERYEKAKHVVPPMSSAPREILTE